MGGGCQPLLARCPEPLVLSADGQSCVPCPVNWSRAGEGWCEPAQEPCSKGYTLAGDGQHCVPCWEGSYSSVGQEACLPCKQGTFSAGGASACLSCAEGSYAAGDAASTCLGCSAGQYAPAAGLSACLSCSEVVLEGGRRCGPPTCGRKQFWGGSECAPCTECLDTTYVKAECTLLRDTVCAACTEVCPNSTALTRYCTMLEDSVCTAFAPCGGGPYLQMPERVCVRCPAGTAGPGGLEPCATCDGDALPNGARSACVEECEAGAYLGSGLYCELCSPGTGSCRPCPENTYSARWGQGQCLQCPNGTRSASGSSACSSATCLR